MTRISLVVVVIWATACTSWSRLPDGRPVPARGHLQVWSGGQEILLRDPRTLGDSIVGQAPLPDTTRHSVALTAVDSLRIQTFDMGKAVIVGSGVAIAVLLMYAAGLQGME